MLGIFEKGDDFMQKSVKVGAGVLAALIVVILGTSLALHFSQKSHDRLDFSIDVAYPENKAFVPGEIIARTLVEIMNNELTRERLGNYTFGLY